MTDNAYDSCYDVGIEAFFSASRGRAFSQILPARVHCALISRTARDLSHTLHPFRRLGDYSLENSRGACLRYVRRRIARRTSRARILPAGGARCYSVQVDKGCGRRRSNAGRRPRRHARRASIRLVRRYLFVCAGRCKAVARHGSGMTTACASPGAPPSSLEFSLWCTKKRFTLYSNPKTRR